MSTPSFLYTLVRFRLMPVTMSFLVLLFMVKLYDLAQGTTRLSDMLIAGSAQAVEDTLEGAPKDAPKEAAAAAEKPAEKTTAAEAPAKEEEGDDVLVGGEDGGNASATADEEVAEDEGSGKKEERHFSPVEVELLQSLSKRRAEIDKYEEEVKMKESLLDATELRINKKLDELKGLQAAVQKILDQYKSQEDTNIRSLVKMYENMKPKSAAAIFNEMEMPVLLLIVDRMSERKAAPILAAMDPLKAKELTIELAEERKVLDSSEEALKEVR